MVQFGSIIELLPSYRPKVEISHVIEERSTAEMPPIVGMTNETLIYFQTIPLLELVISDE